MKISSIIVALSIAGVMNVRAQTPAASQANVPAPTAYAITTRDGNSQVWQRTTYEIGPNGTTVPRIHKYTELATGLNHLVNGQWAVSDEAITILPDGTAAATNGQHQAYFPSDIYNGEIKLVTPDGKVLQSQPVGLSYDDGSNTVLIAVLTNSVGQLVSSNQIVYPNAFVGLNADLRYTYHKSGFEQDVVLHEQPPAPESLGLNAQTAKLQVLTEFFNPPQPEQIKGQINRRNGMTDTTLQFGQMQMVQGKAFVVGDDDSHRQKSSQRIQVYKNWVQTRGRNVLIEELPYQKVTASLQTLPANTSMKGRSVHSLIGMISKSRLLPAARTYTPKNGSIQLAGKDSFLKDGVVLDYDAVDSDQTNFTFQGDSTYYISDPVEFSGTTTIEGGTVIKFSDSLSGWGINISGGVNCKTESYRPAIFTSMDDNSVGETISGSTGSPGTSLGFAIISASSPLVISNLRVCYAYEGLIVNSLYPVEFRDCQFEACGEPIYYNGYSGGLGLYNVLFANCEDAMEFSDGYDYIAENVTADASHGQLNDVDSGVQPTFINLTNCIINAFVDSDSTLLTNGVVINPGGPIFQTVGGGSYYLATNSIYHNAGTTNIDPDLLADIATKTTYPPVAYSNTTFSAVQTFSPQAQRDNIGNPDLGYHYDPLDYTFGGCTVTTNLTFTAGTAVGWFRTTSGWTHAGQGIQLSGNINVAFNGTATAPDYWVRLNTVQENDQTAGYGHGSFESWASPPVPTVTGYFLHCTVMAGEVFNSYFADDYGTIQANMTHSEFWSGELIPYGDYLNYTNCLMWRVDGVGANNGVSASVLTMRNCAMIGGVFTMNRNDSYGQGAMPVSVRDCAFDGTSISTADMYGSNPSVTDYNYNAYTNTTDPFSIGGANDVKGTTFNWQSSWFGDYYQPTNSQLINVGSTTANLVGLYHFTTQTNQIIEGTSQVDIGYHYVATDAYGNPLDSNGNGVPDYLEDANGDGIFDAGDLANWLAPVYGNGSLSFTNGLHILVFEPKSGSQIP